MLIMAMMCLSSRYNLSTCGSLWWWSQRGGLLNNHRDNYQSQTDELNNNNDVNLHRGRVLSWGWSWLDLRLVCSCLIGSECTGVLDLWLYFHLCHWQTVNHIFKKREAPKVLVAEVGLRLVSSCLVRSDGQLACTEGEQLKTEAWVGK